MPLIQLILVWAMSFNRLLWHRLKFSSCLMLAIVPMAAAMETYQTSKEFIHEAFPGGVPKVSKIWIKSELKQEIRKIIQRDLNVLRVKYWEKQGRSAWILEEIGKERPITIGVVINNNEIEKIKVLVFRESRGWEVRYPFFTDQFSKVKLNSDHSLNRHIDGISGATLSVRAMQKMARLALFLSEKIKE